MGQKAKDFQIEQEDEHQVGKEHTRREGRRRVRAGGRLQWGATLPDITSEMFRPVASATNEEIPT